MKTKQSVMTGFVWLLAVMMSATVCLEAFGDSDVAEGGITVTLPGGVELKLVKIKAGSFIMGSPEDEIGRYPHETQHRVTLTKDFWLGQYEVTQAQYKAITGENPSLVKRGGDYAVEYVSWDDAMAFCKKLTELERKAGRLPEGYEYTLPTEAQWEYACRAGTTTALNNGTNLTEENDPCNMDEIGWHKGNSGFGPYQVGQKKPNRWGLYDMHGNVWEWCRDWFGIYPNRSVTDPTGGPASSSLHVLRSGSWFLSAPRCRSANRYANTPDHRSLNYGFRVALAAVDSMMASQTSTDATPGQSTASSSASTSWDGKDKVVDLGNGIKMTLKPIPKGSFEMGSSEREFGRKTDEMQYRVTLTKDFWIGKYEVTQAQYETVMGTNPSHFKNGNDYPVERVSWDDAMAFCKKLTDQERKAGRLPAGYEYSLPTEAQWEYACRAGMTTAWNSGKNLTSQYTCPNLGEIGWYLKNSDDRTHLVGQKKPNRWGLYDMHGNVSEWCRDWFGAYPDDGVTVMDPTGPLNGLRRVYRGGAWGTGARYCRSAARSDLKPSDSGDILGFRVALAAVDSTTASQTSTDETTGQSTASSSTSTGWDGKDKVVVLSNRIKMTLKPIPKGSFVMGSPEDETGRDSDETQHLVTLTKDFWIGKYEVTQAQYEAVMGTNPSHLKNGDHYPVETVSWDDAMAFCKKLTEQERKAGRLPEGYEYTLPTEAQWAYACRAGTTTALNTGKNLTGQHLCNNVDEAGWYEWNSKQSTNPVGLKKPNQWGLYDMHGNVWEWCRDRYGFYPQESVTDPIGASDGQQRVICGGSWLDAAELCRSSVRRCGVPTTRFSNLGFRVALVPVQ